MKFKKAMRFIGRYFFMAVGSGIAAVGINVFLLPYKIAAGR